MCHIVERLLLQAYGDAGAAGRPGLILFVQTFGDLVTFNPHLHVLAADGVFRADGVFVKLPAVPSQLLELGFRSQVLELLVAEGAISETLAALLRTWRHSGFSVHSAVRVRGHDAEGRVKLAQYMLRALLSLENDAGVVQRILKHPGLWAPRQNERAPLAGIEVALPADNVLSYHPVPDIA